MADAQQIRQVYDRYTELFTKGDVEGIVDLYTEDATIEDPIGSELIVGREAIRTFYQASAGSVAVKRTGPTRVTGHEAATPLVILMGPEGQQKALDIISAMSFDDAARVKAMRAWWSYDDLRPATPAD